MRRFLALCKVLKKIDRLNYSEVDNYLTQALSHDPIKKMSGVIGQVNPFTTSEYMKYEMSPSLKEMEQFQYSHLSKKERQANIVSVRKEPKINRNSICPCGSGTKYKKCCLIKNS